MNPVGIIGNFNLDIVVGGLEARPAWDSEVMAEGYERRVAGTAGYMAMALQALGLQPVILSSIGQDSEGAYLLEELQRMDIPADGIVTLENHQTPTSFVIVHKDGSRAIVSVLGAHHEFGNEMYKQKQHLLSSCEEVMICGNYLLPKFTVVDALEAAIEQKKQGKKIYFDPSWDPHGWKEATKKNTLELIKHVDVCLLNETEICHLTAEDDWKKAIKILGNYCHEVVVKLGGKGAAALVDGEVHTVEGYQVPVVDTTGAGDTFDMGYLFANRKAWPVEKKLDFANKMASIIISQESRETYPNLMVHLSEKM
ncbi:PfkB family carbohydrate kinase [Halobacillus rhizosphaerae]|uniref:carbohydrate kinase family protein n=1 Tax=Halobacillus rhizosphaerae TaxID=3064889 RepID=UPI00398A5674